MLQDTVANSCQWDAFNTTGKPLVDPRWAFSSRALGPAPSGAIPMHLSTKRLCGKWWWLMLCGPDVDDL
jgi:hypothetical protein